MRQVHFRASRAYPLVSANKEARVSYTVIKTIKGRQYYYEQTARYRNGKRTPLMRYIGPVDPKRQRKRIALSDIFRALFEVGGYVAVKGTKRPDYKVKDIESGRTCQMRQANLKALYKQYGVDLSSPQAFSATSAHLSQAQRQELMHKVLAAGRAARAPKAPEAKFDWSGLEAKMAANKAARQTAQDAPGRTQEAPAKNFTVDDEIEAREAKFEAAVDEYNAGTTAAPDAPAPDDAPES
ncbi:hypothetical protein Nham_0303 [Nitrobacter hamburgensis X14]|uniref:Uncharacterized protein n=2 Tax=Nitrobacter hamburgensis TaxID=912 RepID=Q1QRE8_NITHX|nr:hypothetical protein Nham_0303 [Nitrobacter hamburgensis X14]